MYFVVLLSGCLSPACGARTLPVAQPDAPLKRYSAPRLALAGLETEADGGSATHALLLPSELPSASLAPPTPVRRGGNQAPSSGLAPSTPVRRGAGNLQLLHTFLRRRQQPLALQVELQVPPPPWPLQQEGKPAQELLVQSFAPLPQRRAIYHRAVRCSPG